jgi:hypothetical protein
MATTTHVIKDLVRRLSEDEWRRTNPFSDDVRAVHQVLFHPYADDVDRQEALAAWFQRYQPCLFGRIAAVANALHYIFLTDDDLREADQHIAERIQQGRRAWWQRSVSPRTGISSPAHGLVLSVVSQRVSLAEPNGVLQTLAEELLRLWNCSTTTEPQGKVHWEDLFLENPSARTFVRFTFSVDFFAAAGDRRWWHDHRIPGGIGFTANSVGHMRRYREWYEHKGDQREWLLETAMGTIERAAETPYGRATWLRPLVDGRPFVTEIACPFHDIKSNLADYDWTRYAGHLHTDHSVRPEFFHARPEKPPEARKKEWVQDFQYLYDRASPDHLRFVEGMAVARKDVYDKVGRPEDYVQIASPRRPKATQGGETRIYDEDRRGEIEALLDVCRGWVLTRDEVAQLAK